jgi:hypothetical protein
MQRYSARPVARPVVAIHAAVLGRAHRPLYPIGHSTAHVLLEDRVRSAALGDRDTFDDLDGAATHDTAVSSFPHLKPVPDAVAASSIVPVAVGCAGHFGGLIRIICCLVADREGTSDCALVLGG